MTPNCEEWEVAADGPTDTLEDRATLRQAGGISQYKTLKSLTTTNARPCTSEGRAPCNNTSLWALRTPGPEAECEPTVCLAAKRDNNITDCVNSTASRSKEVITPFIQHSLDCIQHTASSLGFPNTRKTLTNRSNFILHQNGRGWSTCPVRKDWRSWACSVWSKNSFGGTLTAAPQCLQGGHWADTARLCTVVICQ